MTKAKDLLLRDLDTAIAAINEAMITGDFIKLDRAVRKAKRRSRAIKSVSAALTGHTNPSDDRQ
jgi:hypothetical protein